MGQYILQYSDKERKKQYSVKFEDKKTKTKFETIPLKPFIYSYFSIEISVAMLIPNSCFPNITY